MSKDVLVCKGLEFSVLKPDTKLLCQLITSKLGVLGFVNSNSNDDFFLETAGKAFLVGEPKVHLAQDLAICECSVMVNFYLGAIRSN